MKYFYKELPVSLIAFSTTDSSVLQSKLKYEDLLDLKI